MLMHASKHSKTQLKETRNPIFYPSSITSLFIATASHHILHPRSSIMSIHYLLTPHLPPLLFPFFFSLSSHSLFQVSIYAFLPVFHQHYLIVFILLLFIRLIFFFPAQSLSLVFSLTQLNTLAISVGITAFRGELAPFTNDLASFLSA